MPVILSCLVFVIYETTFGTYLNALRHARTGFNILNERLHRLFVSSHRLTTNGDSDHVSSNGHLVAAPAKGVGQPASTFPSSEDTQIRLESLTEASFLVQGQGYRDPSDHTAPLLRSHRAMAYRTCSDRPSRGRSGRSWLRREHVGIRSCAGPSTVDVMQRHAFRGLRSPLTKPSI